MQIEVASAPNFNHREVVEAAGEDFEEASIAVEGGWRHGTS
jgi:hypothetical protein